MTSSSSMKEMTRICPWHPSTSDPRGPRTQGLRAQDRLGATDRAKPKTALDSAATGLLFGIAIFAIDRTITAWLERNFAFLFAF